jgi:hypothetical protein
VWLINAGGAKDTGSRGRFPEKIGERKQVLTVVLKRL